MRYKETFSSFGIDSNHRLYQKHRIWFYSRSFSPSKLPQLSFKSLGIRRVKENSSLSLRQTFRLCKLDVYVTFLLLNNKLPQTSSFGKKCIYYPTVPLVRLWPWLGWIFCSGSPKTEKILSGLYSFLELRDLFSNLGGCGQNSVPCL